MRLVHTSDWHLGKRLCEASLLDDQAHALEQVFALCRDERADALVIAGDVYDRAVPPEDAVALFGDFLRRVARDLRLPVVAISGNHDSAARLGFGAEILEQGRVYVRTAFDRRAEPVVIDGKGGERVHIYALPYLDPDVARTSLGDETLRGHDAAVRAALVAAQQDRHSRRAQAAVLVGHLFAAGGQESVDSERPLVVGGAAHVGGDALDGWSYVALGHLHEPQLVGGRETVRYSGSLLKYSFGEAKLGKSVSVVDLDEQGAAQVRAIPLSPRRDLVRIEGSFEELLADGRFAAAESAYVEATYTDSTYLIDVATRLRARFPHLLMALPRRLALESSDALGSSAPGAGDLEHMRNHRDLLEGFWKHVTDGELEEGHLEAFERALGAAQLEQQKEQPKKKASEQAA